MLSWDFTLADRRGDLIGSINRNFRGFGRELFTDTGMYILRMDAASAETTNIANSGVIKSFPTRQAVETSSRTNTRGIEPVEQVEERKIVEVPSVRPLTLDERAVMLATAVSIDFDYFSRQSGYPGQGAH
jgi:Scramblase